MNFIIKKQLEVYDWLVYVEVQLKKEMEFDEGQVPTIDNIKDQIMQIQAQSKNLDPEIWVFKERITSR